MMSSSSPSSNSLDPAKCHNGKPKVRPELPYLFEKELTEKQNKRIYVVERFVATERATPIEGKFYSKFCDANLRGDIQRYLNCGEERRMKRAVPVLESQTYGWMPTSISMEALKQINCVKAPKQRCPLTVYGEKRFCERVTERLAFTGVRFYLR